MNWLLALLIKGVIAIVIIIGLVSISFYMIRDISSPNGSSSSASGYKCSNETMTCSDGSIVTRTRPDCSFGDCPTDITNPGTDIKITGTIMCLPPKNTDGPQTLECAFGLKDSNDNYYGLTDPGWKFLIGVSMNTEVTITGKLKTQNDNKYNSIGIIEIIDLQK